jgi:hypothetical protein
MQTLEGGPPTDVAAGAGSREQGAPSRPLLTRDNPITDITGRSPQASLAL